MPSKLREKNHDDRNVLRPIKLCGSHQVVFQPIWKELSLRSHQVTVITPSPLKDPKLTNLTEIDLTKYKDCPLNFGKTFVQGLSNINQDELSDSQVQRLIKDSKVEFDVAIIEFLLPTMVAFGHRFKCPVIGITSLDGTLLDHDIMGNPTHPILNPESTLKFIANPTFFQKVYSVLCSILRKLTSYIILQNEDQVIAKFFGPGYPPLSEMAANIDLFFINVNPAFHNVRPTVPAVIHIGGAMNIQPPKFLSKIIDENDALRILKYGRHVHVPDDGTVFAFFGADSPGTVHRFDCSLVSGM
ncbi:hypothetical protein Trydic_g23565 [Trypoxylus dichotomus]